MGKKFYPLQKDEITILKNHTNLIVSNTRKNIIKKFNVEKMCFSTYSEYKKLLN